MDRAEQVGIGVAVAAHAALFVVLSYGLVAREAPERREAVAVTLTDDVGLTAAAEDRPIPGSGSPEPLPFEDIPPSLPLPDNIPNPAQTSPPTPSATPNRERTRARQNRRRPSSDSRPTNRDRPDRDRRSRRLAGITEGINPNSERGTSSSVASVTGAARSSYTQIIGRQIQPCVNQQSPPGPGSENIRTTLRIRLERDGSLVGRPEVQSQDRYTSETDQYRRRIAEQAVASVIACAPYRGLPDELYRARDGSGWNSVNVRITINPG